MKRLLAIPFIISSCFMSAKAQEVFFPCDSSIQITSEFVNAEKELQATIVMSIRNIKGTTEKGSQDIVYKFFKNDGTPYFSSPNEFTMKFTKDGAQTSIETSEMKKLLFVQGILPLGDASSISGNISAGDTIKSSELSIKAGVLHTSVKVSDRKVLEHRSITIKAGEFDALLIRERVETKMVVGLGEYIVDTWYVKKLGGVLQKIYDKNGKLKSSCEAVKIQM